MALDGSPGRGLAPGSERVANGSAVLSCGRMWCVALTQPQAERWAERNLQSRGYETYLPMIAASRFVTLRRFVQLTPLFPRYLFVQLDEQEPWTPITYAPGVAALVRKDGNRPGIARWGDVEALQAGEEARRSLLPARGAWEPGDACRVSGGAFRDVPAVVVGVKAKRAVVSMLVFGELRNVLVSVSSLRRRE